MMDVVTGKTRPQRGDVLFDGIHRLTELDESNIAELGIGRKFQKPTGVRESYGGGQPAAGAQSRPPRPAPP